MEPAQIPADEDVTQFVKQTPINQLEPQSTCSGNQDQRLPKLTRHDWELQQPGRHSLELQFQDSNLSPALSLLPVNSGVEHNFAEFSLFQHSDYEFAPLRAYPDVSMASDRFHLPPLDGTTQASERGSLSQNPLAQATVLSEEGAGSCSLSQRSMSPGDEGRQEEMVPSPLTATSDIQGVPSRNEASRKEKDTVSLSYTLHNLGEKDEAFFLSKDIPAQHLMELLQKDVGMPSSSSSAVSSASETSVKRITSLAKESKSTRICKPVVDQSMVRREGPPGEASLSEQQTKQPNRDSNPDQSQTLSSEVCNITTGSRSTQPDNSSEALHKELLSEIESSRDAESKNQHLTPYPTETYESKPRVTQIKQGGIPWTGPFSASVEQVHREQDLWLSGNQTGIDGSYLGFLPQSQSTPGVFKDPPKSSVKATLGKLSVIESNKESSYQSNTGISPEPTVPEADVHSPDTENQYQEEQTSAKVQSLPSLNYLQKVDAWRANQSSGKTSLFDSLALQGFSGVSPKKKAYDAVSDTLNRILSQQARSFPQPPVSSASNQNVPQISTTAPSGSSSPRRGEAVGSAPGDKDNTGPAARPSGSSFGRSQSHSSFSTVVMSAQKNQQTLKPAEREKSHVQDNVHHQPSTTAQASPPMSLGHFSDVSNDRDLTLSSSQDSYNVKLGASIGASSVTSLEVDNYAPYWNSKLSTPSPLPKTREFNIEERIPLYLHNLGIDQSPSTILAPSVPRGTIREGSIGTQTESAQPSEGGSPHKGEFSGSSIVSVDSTVYLPFILDSVGPAVSVPERSRRDAASFSSDTEAVQSRCRLPLCSQPNGDSQPSQQRQKDTSATSSQNGVQLGERFDSRLLSPTNGRCGESALKMSHSLEESAEESFVSYRAFGEIHKLLSEVDDVVSAGSSAASSASPAAARLLSDDDIFLSLRKNTSSYKESSFSSFSATADPRTHSSLPWARSSSDSMLTSDKPRQSSVGRESLIPSWQPGYPSTQSLTTAPAAEAYPRLEDSNDGRVTGSSLVLSKSARRAEPEGCSAAPPDNTVPTQTPVTRPLPTVSPPQPTTTPTETDSVPEEEGQASLGGPEQSSSSSPTLGDTDEGAMSDGSSDSSLAVRVAKLLQSESPATMVSSTTSITDQEESKAREWIKMKISGQSCEPLELDKEDRERIEEIKQELLLKYPMKISSHCKGPVEHRYREQRSIQCWSPEGAGTPHSAETLTAPSDAHNQLSLPLQALSRNLSDSHMQLQNSVRQGLEAQVWEIAAREGVTLPRPKSRALTSITIATRKRSTSPSPSTSPAPTITPELLHLTELSTGAVQHPQANRPPEAEKTTAEPPSVLCYTRNQIQNQLMTTNQKRQGAVGCQFEEPAPLGLNREDVNLKDHDSQPSPSDDELPTQDSSVSGPHGAEQATVSSTSESPARTGHVSHVRLTLSPKAADHSLSTAAPSSPRADSVTAMPRRGFVPLRHALSATISPDEGVGLSSPPEWCEAPEPKRQQGQERVDSSTSFKTVSHTGTLTSILKQSFTPRYRPEVTQRHLTTESPAAPVLLPYKPRGSEELFYIPQAEADVSSTGQSDTTMESSHTGSDDAVPPRFSSEVLGHQDPGLDRGVTIRHTEGIYSKRLKTAGFKMQGPGRRDAPVTVDQSSQTSRSQTPRPSSQVSVPSVPSRSDLDSFSRDQATSPLQPLRYNLPGTSRERLQPAQGEEGNKARHHLEQSSDRYIPQPPSQQSRISLDELWQRFCERWTMEESRPTREASLVERLERLSRLIHGMRAAEPREEYHDPYTGRDEGREERSRNVRDGGRSLHGEVREKEKVVGGGGKVPDELAWTRRTSEPSDEDSRASLTSCSSLSLHLGPVDKDASDTLSTISGSMSTVDTARLIRVFGAHRVQHLKTSSSLSKLYNTINKQKEGREQRRGRNRDSPSIITSPSETTDQSTVAADSASTTSSPSFPSHHGASRTLAAKKAVKLVSKGIQTAGDLEIVRNGTRRHTRDVGTTFPSPHETRVSWQNSPSSTSVERGRGGWRSPSKIQSLQKQRKNKRSPSKPYPEGVAWFISADDLRSEARKENQQQQQEEEEEESTWRPSTAWFEPYSRTQPWREPLRPRQVHQDRNLIRHADPDPEPRLKTRSSGLARVSLQEALEMRRPDFISGSTQRVKRLALQAEERRLQADFTRERDFVLRQHGGQGRLPKPAGTALLRRAVPRKEMIQRSKQIYENLPEVQRRREEERRKAEYRSYRLNAQLYNKRITNRVLGRRTAWQ